MKQIYLRVVACTLSVVLLYPAFSFSQTADGSLSGMVTDVMGVAIPKAKVRATRRSDSSVSFETRAADSGSFTFTNLPADVYKVSATTEDGATTQRIVSVPKGRTIQLEIRFSTGCDNLSKGTGVGDEDKAAVFRTTLIHVATESPDKEQLKKGFVLSTQNIKPAWVKGLSDLHIQLLTPAQIQRKADKEGDFQLLSVPEIKVRSQCMVLTFSHGWAKGKGSRTLYLSGSASTYEYRRELGKWARKFIRQWIQ